MLSIQEMADKTKVQRKQIEDTMDHWGFYHPNINTPEHTKASLYDGLSLADELEIRETLRSIPLHEFLSKTSHDIGRGVTYGAYLIPTKVHDTLVGASHITDRVPHFSAQVVNGWKGGDLTVDVAVRQQSGTTDSKWVLKPQQFTSGGQLPTQTVESVEATLSPKGFAISPRITNDLIEDANFQMVEWHLTQAAQQIGQYATDLAIADLKAAADGTGTQCVVAAGAGTTTTAQVLNAIGEVGSEFWEPDTLICTYEAWRDAISFAAAGNVGMLYPPVKAPYNAKFQMLDIVLNNSTNLFDVVTAGLMTKCVTFVLDRSAALLCGRKRWLKINNYSEPIRDLAGVTITCRQDCVTLYKDASCELTET